MAEGSSAMSTAPRVYNRKRPPREAVGVDMEGE